jgi:hypothetical protein
MQNEEAILHVPFEHRPEQQSPFALQALPAVVQVAFGVMDAHFPLSQCPVQQTLPAAGHASPIDMHCAAPHVPFTQAPLQQSVFVLHAAPDFEHAVIDETHCPPRHSVEQQSPFPLQEAPGWLQLPPSLPVAPSPPLALSEPPPSAVPPPSSVTMPSALPELPHASGAHASAGSAIRMR